MWFYLCDYLVQYIDQYKVELMRAVRAEADLQQIVIMRRDAETRQEAVDHQVNALLRDKVLVPVERFSYVEQQVLQQMRIHHMTTRSKYVSTTTHQSMT